MSTISKCLLGLALACPIPALASVEITASKPIGTLLYNGESGIPYYYNASGWGAPTCPGATYVQVSSTLANRKELFAAALAAHMAGRTVRFRGTCNQSSSNTFDAYYIEIDS